MSSQLLRDLGRDPLHSSISRAVWVRLWACLFLVTGDGCESTPRVNHYHNDASHKIALDAVDQFDQFTTGTASLTAVLDADIKAREALERTVSATRTQVLDTELSKLSTDVNWVRLRLHLLEATGLLREEGVKPGDPIGPDNPPVSAEDPALPPNRARQLMEIYNMEFAERIELRQARVSQVIDVHKLIAAVEEALVKQAQLDVAQATKVLQDVKAATQPTTKPVNDADLTRICFLSSILNRFNAIGDSIRTEKQARARSSILQAKLLGTIRDTRDSGSAVALVAMLGTGLDDDSFALLDDYLKRIEDQNVLAGLMKTLETTPPQTDPSTGTVTQEWAAVQDALKSLLANQTPARLAAFTDQLKQLISSTGKSAEQPGGANPPAGAQPPAVVDKVGRTPMKQLARAGQRAKPISLAESSTTLFEVESYLQSKGFVIVKDLPEGNKRAPAEPVAPEGVQIRFHRPNEDLPGKVPAGPPDPNRSKNVTKPTLSAQELLSLTWQAYRTFPSISRRTPDQLEKMLTDARRSIQATSKILRSGSDGPTDDFLATLLSDTGPSRAAIALASKEEKGADNRTIGSNFLKLIFSPNPKFVAALADRLGEIGSCDNDTPSGGVANTGKDSGKPAATHSTTLQSKVDAAGSFAKSLQGILGGLTNDIQKEQALVKLRLQEFVNMVFKAQLDLNGENARHTGTMLAIAQLELKRWVLLGKLNDSYGEVFEFNTADAQAELQARIDVARKDWGAAAREAEFARKEFVNDQNVRQAAFDVYTNENALKKAMDDQRDLCNELESLTKQLQSKPDERQAIEKNIIKDEKKLDENSQRIVLLQSTGDRLNKTEADLLEKRQQYAQALRKVEQDNDDATFDSDLKAAALKLADVRVEVAKDERVGQASVVEVGRSLITARSAAAKARDEVQAAQDAVIKYLRRGDKTGNADFKKAHDSDLNRHWGELDDAKHRLTVRESVVAVYQSAKALIDAQFDYGNKRRQAATQPSLQPFAADALEHRSTALRQIADEAERYEEQLKAKVLLLEGSRDLGKERPLSVRLFRDVATKPSQAIKAVGSVAAVHPTIDEDNPIHASLRTLAAASKAARAAPNEAKGTDVSIANARLFKAVRTVSGHLLMSSSNQYMSEDNAIRLRTEIAEHDLQLDSLETRVEEAGYRLTLGDLQAFHSSGINDSDIKAIQSAIETGLFGWLVAK